MAGTISEFFGYRAEDNSPTALQAAHDKKCPFIGCACTKVLGRLKILSGACAIRQKKPGSPSVICCPNRIYAEEYKMLRIVPLDVIEEHCTTVYKVQEAFSAVSLPEGNVYGNALKKCLYG